ncbi:unnamed protein product [Paramecium primaurelia]|uniref:Uncharacterized protein n=1 Tax=Paramecium primaurelia TaxID=5886 RepID=A0A8S1KNW5_PARPR|nr:unnamed protein product [Paramecium primaurelia]
MLIQQYSQNDSFICVEMQCPYSRIITSWDLLKLHNQLNHKVIPKQKLESKVAFKYNQYNQQQRMKVQEDIYQLIQQYEDRIIFKIQELFEFLKNTYLNIIQDQIYFDYQLQSLSNQHFIEADLQQYIEIYYGQIQTSQQEQVALFLCEIQSKLSVIENDFLNLLEKNFIIENQNQQSIIHYQQNVPEFNDSTISESFIIKPNVIQQNHYQTEFISNEAEQMKYEMQQIQYDQNISQSQSTQLIEQDDLNNIPLKGYKQFQQKQQNQSNYTENISSQDDDRLRFQLPSETSNSPIYSNNKSNNKESLYVPKTEKQEYYYEDNPKQKQKKKKEERVVYKPPPKEVFFGKKFDLINSHKHLKFSQNNQAFLCHQQGIGLVEGILTLKIDAEIRLKFSEAQKRTFQAEIGIQNVDKDGKMKGSQQYSMNEIGDLISNNQVYKGKLKITLNQEYMISYSSNERMLYFINGKTEEYLDLDKVSGNFKFYVKVYGLKVSILY